MGWESLWRQSCFDDQLNDFGNSPFSHPLPFCVLWCGFFRRKGKGGKPVVWFSLVRFPDWHERSIKDLTCPESFHFRRQGASSVRQLVGTAHQQETSSEAARRWRCPAPFLSSTAPCIEVYISVNFGISVSSQNLVLSLFFLQAKGGLEQQIIGEWKVPTQFGKQFSCFTYLALKC